MVVRYFDFLRAVISPSEANAELIIDSDRMLPGTVALQGFQPISGWQFQIIELHRRMEHHELATGDLEPVGREAFA